MSIITIVGAGMMGSAMCFPASDNGHVIRLVGTPYDHDVIQRIKQDNFHPRLGKPLPPGVTAYFYEELDSALGGIRVRGASNAPPGAGAPPVIPSS